jgi:type II secretory pathway pseudopilin PulG
MVICNHRKRNNNTGSRVPPHRIPGAFTLVEMLVVIGIVIILMALILPALFNAKESGRAACCASNQHQITLAFVQFAVDHNGYLPGNQWDSKYQQPNDPWKRDWLLGDDANQGNAALQVLDGPQNGTVYKYLNHPGVYRCPSYYVGAPFNSGIGSNGRFDYAAFIVFSGARIASLQPKARFHYSTTNMAAAATNVSLVGTGGIIDQNVFTPLVCEEESQGGLNGGNVEGGHCNSDRIGHVHFGGGNYSSVDGSVHRFMEQANQNAWSWEAIAPSGKWSSLGYVPNPGFGFWSRQ